MVKDDAYIKLVNFLVYGLMAVVVFLVIGGTILAVYKTVGVAGIVFVCTIFVVFGIYGFFYG